MNIIPNPIRYKIPKIAKVFNHGLGVSLLLRYGDNTNLKFAKAIKGAIIKEIVVARSTK